MQQGGKKNPKTGSLGFTIIEVMIVLAVTGALFISAVIAISGRQSQTEFDQGIRQVYTQIQQTINEVATGFYPNLGDLNCTAGVSPVLSTGSTSQGSNSGCIFVGKVLQFKVHDTDPEDFTTFSLAGLQKTSTGKEVTSLAETKPTAIAPSSTNPNVPDETVRTALQYGITTASMSYSNGGPAVNVGAVGFVSSLAQYSGNDIVSGTQQVNMVPVGSSALDTTKLVAAEAINNQIANSVNSPLNPSGGVHICFASGTTNQSGLVTIGTNGRELAVTLDIRGNKTCA